MSQNHVTGEHPVLGNSQASNPFASSGLFVSTADVWTPYKMSFEGFAGAGKTLTMCLVALGIWRAEGKKGHIVLVDTEKSAKFIVPFFRQHGLIEGQNLFVTHTRSLQRWGEILALCEKTRGTIMMTDTVTHVYEEMLVQFERDQKRKVKYPGDAMLIKPMWKEKFSNPFTQAGNCHLLFTGRAAWEYTMSIDEETGKKSFDATGVKMRGDNELAYEPDVVVLMERAQQVIDGQVEVARRATILKDRSRLIDGGVYYFTPTHTWKQGENRVWEVFAPVYQLLASGNQAAPKNDADKNLGPLFQGNSQDYWERRRQVDILLEEIDGVYQQWIPGSGAAEKQLKSFIFQLQFNTSSKSALAERPPAELRRGLEAIEHLAKYVAKHIDHLEKMHKAGEYENIQQFLSEEKSRYETGGTAPMAPPPADDDQIPEFGSPSEKQPATELAAKAAAAVEKVKTDPVQTMSELFAAANSVDEIEQIREGFAPIIATLDPEIREQVEGLAEDRRAELMVLLAEINAKKGTAKKARAARNGKRAEHPVA
jgi:hypothetical protein